MSTLGASLRLMHSGWVLAREGVLASLPGDQLSGMPRFAWRISRALARRRAVRKGRTERLADAVERLGPSYVKLGQFLATRPDVVGKEMALDLAGLQDRMATFPRTDAVASIDSLSGVNLDEEAANMLRYQQAYQAAAQMIRVTQELMDTLMNAVSR